MSDIDTFNQITQACLTVNKTVHTLSQFTLTPSLTPLEFLNEVQQANKILLQVHRQVFPSITPAQNIFIESTQQLLTALAIRVHFYTNTPFPQDTLPPAPPVIVSHHNTGVIFNPPPPPPPPQQYRHFPQQQQQHQHQYQQQRFIHPQGQQRSVRFAPRPYSNFPRPPITRPTLKANDPPPTPAPQQPREPVRDPKAV